MEAVPPEVSVAFAGATLRYLAGVLFTLVTVFILAPICVLVISLIIDTVSTQSLSKFFDFSIAMPFYAAFGYVIEIFYAFRIVLVIGMPYAAVLALATRGLRRPRWHFIAGGCIVPVLSLLAWFLVRPELGFDLSGSASNQLSRLPDLHAGQKSEGLAGVYVSLILGSLGGMMAALTPWSLVRAITNGSGKRVPPGRPGVDAFR